MRNIEIKLRAPEGRDLAGILREELGARSAGLEEQHDVFFRCRRGRLKLRLVPGKPAQLIHYERTDAPDVRPSDHFTVEIQDGAALLHLLDAALGRTGEVRKHRRLFRLENVRLHLDEVKGLGSFVEIEAVVDASHDEATCRKAVEALLVRLGVDRTAAESLAYVDLLARAPRSARPPGSET